MQPIYGAQEFKLAQTPPSRGTNSHLSRVEPREIHIRPVYDSNKEPLDLNSRTRFHWTNVDFKVNRSVIPEISNTYADSIFHIKQHV